MSPEHADQSMVKDWNQLYTENIKTFSYRFDDRARHTRPRTVVDHQHTPDRLIVREAVVDGTGHALSMVGAEQVVDSRLAAIRRRRPRIHPDDLFVEVVPTHPRRVFA